MPRLLIPLLLAAALLAGCDTAEERAEAHHKRATELLAEGKVEQAIVEFRNVFQLDGNNAAARLEYANLMVEQGNLQEAIGQFLRLVEQDWGNVAGHKRLAELALQIQDLPTAETHASRAYELDPADPEIRAYKATVDYHAGKHEAAVKMAEGVLKEVPGNLPAQMVLIADRMRAEDDAGAIELIETALQGAPKEESLHLVKLAVLERRGDDAAVGAELVRMTELFPENEAVAQARIQWHLRSGDIDAAEPLMRARADATAAGTPERTAADLALVQALYQTRGADAARGELDRLVAAAPESIPYRRARAGVEVSEGDAAAGVAALKAIIDGAAPSDERRDTQVVLAQVLLATGDAAGAAALVDAVLAEDATQVAALKLRAQRMIDGDQPEAAIRDLRTALDQAPQDPEILTLMAMAHERAGAHELAAEQLALAVEASGDGPAESIRYARFLIQDGRVDPARAVIAEALRRNPRNVELMAELGRIALGQQDWDGARRVAAGLRALGDQPGAADQATALEAQVLSGQNHYAEAIDMLQGLSGEAGDVRPALPGIVQTYLRAGDVAGARTYLAGVVEETPDVPLPRLMLAGVTALAGDAPAAEAAYRQLVADRPDYAPAYQGLYLLLAATGQAEAARATLEQGLAATDGDPRLLFVQAGQLEAEGDFDAAIAVYERLYAQDTASEIIANNLASLLSSHRADPASQERAFTIARRLRSAEEPHFQDTYGWILVQRGDDEAALPHLERAAAGLPQEPLVLYHLGAAQHGLGLPAARRSLEQALAAAGPGTPEAAMAEARSLLEQIRSAPPPPQDPAQDPAPARP